MIGLHLESATDACSVAVSSNAKVIGEHDLIGKNVHSKQMVPIIKMVMSESNTDMQALDYISIGLGPGSYTGLRVGSAVAKGLAYALNVPLIGISTLDIISAPYQNLGHEMVVGTVDARRNEAYISVFDMNGGKTISDTPQIFDDETFQQFIKDIKGTVLFCGTAAEKAKSNFETLTNVISAQSYPRASNAIDLALVKFEQGQYLDTAYFKPSYIKPPNIIKSKKKWF